MEIQNYKEVNDGPVIARFDVYLGPNAGVAYPNFKVLRAKNGEWYIRRPAYVQSEDSFGKKQWGYYPEMSKEKWESLNNQLIPLIKSLINEPSF